MKLSEIFCRLLCISAILILLGACSGGEGGTGLTKKVVNGPITALDNPNAAKQITVNNTQFDTGSAPISLNKVAGTNADLRLGIIVTVTGIVNEQNNSGVAEKINIEASLRGPIASEVVNSSLQVLGQTVLFDANTEVSGIDLTTTPLLGIIVEVSGFINTNGILATRIEAIADVPEDFELIGTINQIDKNAFTLVIGTLTVDYSSMKESVDPNLLDVGVYVEIEGTLDAVGVFIANEIEFDGFEDGGDTEFEGLVTQLGPGPQQFTLQTTLVQYNDTTTFDNGVATDISLNKKLNVKGEIVDKTLIATEISFELDE